MNNKEFIVRLDEILDFCEGKCIDENIVSQIEILKKEIEEIEKAQSKFAKNTLDDLFNYL